jgi:prepilin-type processing-associated H-X9-DG protein
VAGWENFANNNPDNTNILNLVNHDLVPNGAFLGPYAKNPSSWKCPADKSLGQMASGPTPRVRSVSCSNFVGKNPNRPGDGLWTSPSRFKVFTKMGAVKLPTMTFCYLDEREDSINDGWFASDPDNMWQIVDFPASYHGSAAGFAFVDGHSEIHRWKDARTMPNLTQGMDLPLNQNYPNDIDIIWLAQHAAGVGVYP